MTSARFVTNLHMYSQKCGSCNKSFDILQAHIRMRSYGLRQLVDDKSVANCHMTCCKLIVKTCYSQARCKFFQQVVTSLLKTSCNKLDFSRLLQLAVQ